MRRGVAATSAALRGWLGCCWVPRSMLFGFMICWSTAALIVLPGSALASGGWLVSALAALLLIGGRLVGCPDRSGLAWTGFAPGTDQTDLGRTGRVQTGLASRRLQSCIPFTEHSSRHPCLAANATISDVRSAAGVERNCDPKLRVPPGIWIKFPNSFPCLAFVRERNQKGNRRCEQPMR